MAVAGFRLTYSSIYCWFGDIQSSIISYGQFIRTFIHSSVPCIHAGIDSSIHWKVATTEGIASQSS